MKKRRTVDDFPELARFKEMERAAEPDWRQRGKLRVNLDEYSMDFLEMLSINDDVEESTWLQLFAARLLADPTLERHIFTFARTAYNQIPAGRGTIYRVYAMPLPLRQLLMIAAGRSAFGNHAVADPDAPPLPDPAHLDLTQPIPAGRALSPFLRCAILYVAIGERSLTMDALAEFRASQPQRTRQ